MKARGLNAESGGGNVLRNRSPLQGDFVMGAFPRAESFRPWAVLLDHFMVDYQALEREIAGLKFGKNVADENVRFDAERQPVFIIRDPATAALKAFVCFQL
jgi:hypothetical protein